MKNSFRGFYGVTAALLFVILLFKADAYSQVSDKVLSYKAGTGIDGQPLTISVELANTSNISQVLLAYRPTGSSEFRQMEASLSGNNAMATIRGAEVTPIGIEYYFIIKIQGKDSIETYYFPAENPDNNPLRVEIQGAGGGGNKTVIFLSPEPGSSQRLEDLLISISLLNADSTVDRKSTKLIVDDRDVTKFAVISEDLITLVPENIDPPLQDGPHNVRVELYKTDGSIFYKTNQSFTQLSTAAMEQGESEFKYNFSGQAETRNENLQSNSTQYDRLGLNANTQYKSLQVNGKVYITDEDKPERQPQNRYLIEAKMPWIKASYGDAYPVFPSLIMSGKRIRGTTANLALGFFNLDYADGEIVRKVEGTAIKTFPKDSLTYYTTLYPTASFGPYDTTVVPNIWAIYSYGTYQRKLTAIRPSFGSGSHFQWGFTYLKSKDDVGSILYGAKPQENTAVGTDMTIAADNRNFLITAQGSASVVNKDISRGTLTDAQIDSLFNNDADSTKKRQDLKDLRDKINPYITVNENLVPLSAEKLNSIMAGEAAIQLNYFDNFLKAGYIYRGTQYSSFGQTYIRNDVKGVNVYDRVRLMQNQLFVSGSIEQLSDNLDESKIATTDFSNTNATVSYFPRINFPNITVGYGRNTSSNGLNGTVIDTTGLAEDTSGTKLRENALDSTKLKNAIEDISTRMFIQLGYDLPLGGYRHSLTLNISTAERDDKTLQQLNTRNTSISFTTSTTWQPAFSTSIGLTQNLNKNPYPTGPTTPATLVDYNYTSISLSARYKFMEDKMLVGGMIAPTFGDFQRTLWNANADYLIMKDLTVSTYLSLMQNPGYSSDTIWSLMLKYNM